MRMPCRRCGGSGKVFAWSGANRTRKLTACPVCKGAGWHEADGAFADQPHEPAEYGSRAVALTLDQTEHGLALAPTVELDDPDQ